MADERSVETSDTGLAAGGRTANEAMTTGMVSVSAPAIAGAPALGGGGGFKFAAEELDSVIAQWEDLHDSLDADRHQAKMMAQLEPPGLEFASTDFADGANPSGKAFLEANERMRKYVGEYVQSLRAARQRISTQDEQSQQEVLNAGEMPA